MSPRDDDIEFRVQPDIAHDIPSLGGVRCSAGFEDWNDRDAFVVQLEEAIDYDPERQCVVFNPIARFDHGRPHDMFHPSEGIHMDVYRRESTRSVTLDFDKYPSPRDPDALFSLLVKAMCLDANVDILARYYLNLQNRINPSYIQLGTSDLW